MIRFRRENTSTANCQEINIELVIILYADDTSLMIHGRGGIRNIYICVVVERDTAAGRYPQFLTERNQCRYYSGGSAFIVKVVLFFFIASFKTAKIMFWI